jgi:hypothetical protein
MENPVETFDYKKRLKDYYLPSRKGIHEVEVPSLQYIMIDGYGDPTKTPSYGETVTTLYGAAYTLKFFMKKNGLDYSVPPLEGLWWMEDMREFNEANKHRWTWTMMIMVPDPIGNIEFAQAMDQFKRKKNPALFEKIRLVRLDEGTSIQTLYFGAYVDEAPTIASMHEYIRLNNLIPTGKHHEIYLGDPRKTAPEKLKTVLRQPVKRQP